MTSQYARLISLHQPGGESAVLNSQPTDLSMTFTSGGTFTDNTLLEGTISNLSLSSSSVLDPGCFEYGCFVGAGIWTTAVTTSITQVVNGTTQYWVEGTLDSQGNCWILNLGYVDPLSGSFNFLENTVPISSSGQFQSTVPMLANTIKLAALYQVTPTTLTPVFYYYGTYQSGYNLSRSNIGYLLKYNSTDQCTDLEILSQGLLSLLLSTYKNSTPGTTTFYTTGEMDYSLSCIIQANLTVLASLLDTTSTTRRQYSIPRYLTTYSTYNLIYNDYYYTNPTVSCFTSDCFDSTCFEDVVVSITPSREVSTRAMAWYCLLLYYYTVYFNDSTYSNTLSLVAQYLIQQINPTYNLPSQGWTTSPILSQSTEELTFNLSTSVVTYLALVHHYNYSYNVNFLEAATDIQEAIYSQLYNFSSLSFLNSLSDSTTSIDTLTYGLLLSSLTNRADITESLISTLTSSLIPNYGAITESLSNGSITYNNPLSEQSLLATPANIKFSTLPYSSTTLSYLTNSNYLLYLTTQLASNPLDYFLPAPLQNTYSTFLSTTEDIEETNSFLSLCYTLEGNSPFALLTSQDYQLTTNLSFERSSLFNQVADLIPLNFGWFSQAALTLGGNLYALLKSFTNNLSSFPHYSRDVISNNYLHSLKGYRLSSLATSLYSVSRLPQEPDDSLLSYISSVLNGNEVKITATGLTNRLARYGLTCTIQENYDLVLYFNSPNQIGTPLLGSAYISGESYASNKIVSITIPQPISPTIQQEIANAMPIAVTPLVTQVIQLTSQLTPGYALNNSSYSLCPFILQEDGAALLQEDESYACLEGSLNTAYILQEDESYILQESNFRTFQEDTTPPS